jgi:hypothetical protein
MLNLIGMPINSAIAAATSTHAARRRHHPKRESHDSALASPSRSPRGPCAAGLLHRGSVPRTATSALHRGERRRPDRRGPDARGRRGRAPAPGGRPYQGDRRSARPGPMKIVPDDNADAQRKLLAAIETLLVEPPKPAPRSTPLTRLLPLPGPTVTGRHRPAACPRLAPHALRRRGLGRDRRRGHRRRRAAPVARGSAADQPEGRSPRARAAPRAASSARNPGSPSVIMDVVVIFTITRPAPSPPTGMRRAGRRFGASRSSTRMAVLSLAK